MPIASVIVVTLLGLVAGFALYYRALRRDRVLDRRIVLISLAAIVGDAAAPSFANTIDALERASSGP